MTDTSSRTINDVHHQDGSPCQENDRTRDEMKIANCYRQILAYIGEDPTRDSLLKTPERAAMCLLTMTKGYEGNKAEAVRDAVYDAGKSQGQMIVVKDLALFSMCEHHLQPIVGKIAVAYVPDRKLIGLSKIARIIEIYSKRLQEQERLTMEIADAINKTIQPAGIAVIIEASHMCMVLRGVKQTDSKTVTSAMVGVFKDDMNIRQEFYSLLNH